MSLLHVIMTTVECPSCGLVFEDGFDLDLASSGREYLRIGDRLPSYDEVPVGRWEQWAMGQCGNCKSSIEISCRFEGRLLIHIARAIIARPIDLDNL